MSDRSAFYGTTYSTGGTDVQTRVRYETYDEDLGQAGWLQAAEAREFAFWLGEGVRLMLDVACGSGGISAFLAAELGAAVVGIDSDRHAIAAANERGAEGCSFQVADGNERLPFADGSFDVVFSNNSVHHLRDRFTVLRDWGSCSPTQRPAPLYGGPRCHRPGIERGGSPAHVHGPLRVDARRLERTRDRSRWPRSRAVGGSIRRGRRGRWSAARRSRTVPERADRHRGHRGVRSFQDFLEVAVSLAAERRLSRWVFHARKPGASH